MNDMQRVLVVIRATRDCVKVVEYAVMVARKFNASLCILDVIHNPFAYDGWNLPMPTLNGEYNRLLKETREALQVIVEEEARRGLSIEPLIREGDPAEVIMGVVEEKKIDLLIMPAHEENRIEHFLFGKANEKVIRKMPCSIMLVKEGPFGSCE